MKLYSIGLLTAVTLTLNMAAYSQETLTMTATNDNSIQTGTTNMTDKIEKTEEYLNPGAPIQVKAGQNFTIKMESNPTTGYSQGTTNPSEPIQVKTGQRFTIRMQSNPTTGYGWRLSKADEKVVQFVTNAYIPPDSKLCGAGGHEVWTFKAIREGQAEISMKYIRPWEKDQPARTNVYTVIVK